MSGREKLNETPTCLQLEEGAPEKDNRRRSGGCFQIWMRGGPMVLTLSVAQRVEFNRNGLNVKLINDDEETLKEKFLIFGVQLLLTF